MEEEIDLRQYILILLRHWKWVVAVTVVAALVALVVSFLLPPTYEATAIVLITQPRYLMQFDPRFETIEQWTPAYKAFPTLATSDDVLQRVLDAYTPSPEAGIENWDLETLSEMVEATSAGDPSLVVLKVRSRSPQDAAGIASVWATVLVVHGNEMYSMGEQDLTFFEEQAAQAEQALHRADAALIEFQARNQASIVGTQLDSLRQAQADYLTDQRAIVVIIQNARGLRSQLAQRPTDNPSSFADDLTALFLQISAFNTRTSPAVSEPIQLQVSSAESLSNRSVAEQIAFLDDLVRTLEAKSAEIDERLAELEPQILTLQQRLQEFKSEEDRLIRARDLARETYMTLARKVEEARIAAAESNGVLQVGSYAAPPEKPVSPRKMLNTAVAGALGLMLGVLGVFAVEWWRGGAGDKETGGHAETRGRGDAETGETG